MKKLLFFPTLLALVLLLSCGATKRPISKTRAYNNQNFFIEYLFEHDGCKVYRFQDQGNYVYFTNCNSDVTAIKDDSTKTVIQNKVRVREID